MQQRAGGRTSRGEARRTQLSLPPPSTKRSSRSVLLVRRGNTLRVTRTRHRTFVLRVLPRQTDDAVTSSAFEHKHDRGTRSRSNAPVNLTATNRVPRITDTRTTDCWFRHSRCCSETRETLERFRDRTCIVPNTSLATERGKGGGGFEHKDRTYRPERISRSRCEINERPQSIETNPTRVISPSR